MKKTSGFRRFSDILLVFILIATSGFYYFYSSIEYVIIGAMLVVILFFSNNIWTKLDKVAILIIGLFVIWESIQFLILGGFEFRPLLGTATRFFLAYGVIKLVDRDFLKHYVNIVYFFAFLSLIFYFLFFVPNISEVIIHFAKDIKPLFEIKENYDVDWRPDIIIFNYHGYELSPKRNSGPFWEPGAFAIFLNLALFFNLVTKNRLISFKNLILILAIITAYSTTGILVLFLILTWYFYQTKIALLLRILVLTPTILLFLNLYFEVDFLGQKVQENIENAPTTTSSRFGSALADWILFQKNPVLGYGRNLEAKYGLSFFDISVMHRNNGLTSFFVTWGIILGLLYFSLYYISLRNVTRFYRRNERFIPLVAFLIIILSGFSQGIFQYPFFHALMFLGFVVYKKYIPVSQPNNISTVDLKPGYSKH